MKSSQNSLSLSFLKKISSLIVKIRYRKVPYQYIYFYRDTLVCKLNQAKYFWKDYISPKKYKVISFSGEFGAELQFVLPFAYWHYKNNTLKQTASALYTKELYFFSENHIERSIERTNEGNYNFEFPRILYSQDYNMKKWIPVPLKSVYRNKVYIYDKPLLIIANKFNTEWDGPPTSFFSIEILEFMISLLKEHYTIIYNRPQGNHIVNDNSEIHDLNEFEWLKQKHPDVLLLNELYEKNEIMANNFNHFQLCVYANCENFISVHGGTATLASYFGGKNLIFSQAGGEHYFGCYHKLYPQFSGAAIYHAKNEEDLKTLIHHFL